MTKTVVGLFETQAAAEAAVNALISLGYTNDQIGVALRGETRAASASSNDPLLMDVRTDADGVRKVLTEGATSGWNAEEYANRLNYGGVVLTVQAEESQVEELEALLQRYGAVDLAQRNPTQTIDPTESAVQEADAVDKRAASAVANQIAQRPAGTGSNDVPASATNVPLASSAQVAATRPSGIATLRPGDGDAKSTTPAVAANVTAPPQASLATQHAATPSHGSVRVYANPRAPYHREGDGYPTPDLNENAQPLDVMPEPVIVSTATGANPPPRERDLTLGEDFGGVMEDPSEEARAESLRAQSIFKDQG